MSKTLTVLFEVSGEHYSDRNYGVVTLDEEQLRSILARMAQVREMNVFSITEYAGSEIDFVSGIEFSEEEDEEVFEHDCKLLGPHGKFEITPGDDGLELERRQTYDTMVCWTAYLKHADPPLEIEVGPLYKDEIEEHLGIATEAPSVVLA